MDIVLPGDRDYPGLQHVYSATGAPAAVARPRSAEEVAEALAFARSQDGPMSIRSGGHGISSIATNDGGTVIDLGLLRAVDRIGDTVVRLEPGARWGEVARRLAPWGLAITSGDSGDVGVGGLGTTGGIGLLGRLQGLTIDRVRAAEIVTADGIVRRVSDEVEPDLFWAVRGAGANVGIVTALEVEAGSTAVVAQATAVYDLQNPARFLEEWGRTLEAAPRTVSAFLYISAGFRPMAQATIVVATAVEEEAVAGIEPFLMLPGLSGRRAALVSYADVPTMSGAPHSGQQSARSHSGLAVHLDASVSRELARLVEGGAVDMVQVRSMGGAMGDVDPRATAFAHRHQQFSIMAVSGRGGPQFDEVWGRARHAMDGMYLSFESAHGAGDLVRAFPEPTLSRLRTIKGRWDPEGVFSQNFDVAER